MRKHTLAAATIFLAVVTVIPLTLRAQNASGPDRGSTVSSLDANTADLVKIYSNLGPPHHRYDARRGRTIEEYSWAAMPFRIKADATVTRIKIAMQHISKTNGFTLYLVEDASGLPLGQVDGQWSLKHLPPMGTCCTLKVVNDRQGIRVQKGEKYWLVAGTDATNFDTTDRWAFTWNHIKSNDIAVLQGPLKWGLVHGAVSAFAVYGTRP
jgi:hypothetical protein